MKNLIVPLYSDFISLLKDPKRNFQWFVEKANLKLEKLLGVKDKGWNNFIVPALSIYYFDIYLISLIHNFNDTSCISKNNKEILLSKVGTWQNLIVTVPLFNEVVAVAEKTYFKKNEENKYLYQMIENMAAILNLKCSSLILRRITLISSMVEKSYDCSDKITEVFETREKRNSETCFVVDSLAILRTFAPKRLSEAKEVSKNFNLKEKYALPLDSETFDAVMLNCPDRAFRKKVYLKYFESKRKNKWHLSENIIEILKSHYKEVKDVGYTSVCRYVSEKDGFTLTDMTRFLNSAQSELFTKLSKELESLEKFAKEECGIYPLREWDKDYVYRLKKEKALNAFVKLSFNKNNVWLNLFALIRKTFGYSVKELDYEKFYVNDKVLGIYEDGKLLNIIYVSVEKHKNKYPLNYFNFNHTNYVWGERVVPFSIISLTLEKNGVFNSLLEIKNLVHEFGHAMQFTISQNYNKEISITDFYKNKEGLDEILLEFPSQWFESLSRSPDFLFGVMMLNKKYCSREQIVDYLKLEDFDIASYNWNLLFNCKADWMIYKNESGLKNINEIYRNLRKEFGFYTSKNDKALVDFEHFHLKGRMFSYIFTLNLVSVFQNNFSDYTLREKGNLIKSWLYDGYNVSVFDKFKEQADVFIFIDNERLQA